MVPAWLASVIVEKLVEAGVSAAQSLFKDLPPTEKQLEEYLSHIEQQQNTLPHKIGCPARNAALAVDTFFLWPQLEAVRGKTEDGGRNKTLPKRIPARNLLFSPPADKNLFAVEGPAGVGKTTLARSLIYWGAKETLKLLRKKEAALARPLLPIYLDAWDLAQIANAQANSETRWEQIPGNWGLLLVVDGLDELEQHLKNRALERMKGPWLQGASRNLVFLFGRPGSARTLPWESREERVLTLELRPWSLEEVKSYLERWSQEGSLQEEDAERIFQHLRENFVPPIVPLLMYLLVCDFLETRSTKSLPKTQIDLYEKYLIYTILYEAEEAATSPSGTTRPLSREELFALGCLELVIKENPELETYIRRPRANCNARSLYELERKWQARCKELVDQSVSWDTLLLTWQKRGLCWLGHKSFHDYLAAKALAKRYEGRPEDFWREWLHPRLFDPYWTQVLVFATALLPDSDRGRILRGLLELYACDPITRETHRHHAVIAEIIAESESVEESLLRAWLPQEPAPEHIARIHRTAPQWSLSVLETLAQGQEPRVRLEAARTLAQLGYREKALPTLETLAQDQNGWVRLQAAKALSQLNEKALLTLEKLAQHQSYLVRLEVANALAELGEKALPRLEKLAQHQDSLVRLGATEALAKFSEKALPTLEKLAQDQDSWVRLQAALALAQIGHHEKALPTLEKLAQDRNPDIRLQAALALAPIGYHEKALAALEKLAQNQDPDIRLQAALALAQLGHPPLCLKELPKNQTTGVRPGSREY